MQVNHGSASTESDLLINSLSRVLVGVVEEEVKKEEEEEEAASARASKQGR